MAVQKIRQQRTPAQFGADATRLSEPNKRHSQFVQQGVVDTGSAVQSKMIAGAVTQGAAGLGELIEMGTDFHTGLQLADVEKEHEANIKEFVDSTQNPVRAAAARNEVLELGRQSENIFTDRSATIEDVNSVQDRHLRAVERLRKANEKGVISVQEFQDRALAITRNAVNKNPHLMQEILGHTKKVFSLSGIDSFVDSRQKAAEAQLKVQENVEKHYQSEAERLHFPMLWTPDGRPDVARLKPVIERLQKREMLFDAISQQSEATTKLQAQREIQFLESPDGMEALLGGVDKTLDEGISLFQNNVETNPQEAVTSFRTRILGLKQQIQARAARYLGNTAVKSNIDLVNKNLDAMVNILNSDMSQEDMAKMLTTQKQMLSDNNWIRLLSRVNTSALDLQIRMAEAIGWDKYKALNPRSQEELTDTYDAISHISRNQSNVNLGLQWKNGKLVIPEMIAAHAGFARDDFNNPETVKQYSNMIEGAYENRKSAFTSRDAKFNFYQDLFTRLGNPHFKDSFKNLSEQTIGKASEMVQEFAAMTMANYERDLNNREGVKVERLPDGRITFTGGSSFEREFMNKKYATRMNATIKTLTNLTGGNTNGAAEIIFQRFPALNHLSKQQKEETSGAEKVLNSLVPDANAGDELALADDVDLFGTRRDGSFKGAGFKGLIPMTDGSNRVMTELTIDVDIGGKKVAIPSIVPSLTKAEIDHLAAGGEVTEEIQRKAILHAVKRANANEPVFARNSESPATSNDIAKFRKDISDRFAREQELERFEVDERLQEERDALRLAILEQEAVEFPDDKNVKKAIEDEKKKQAKKKKRKKDKS